MPTQEQLNKINEIQKEGFVWNKHKSTSACGIVMTKGTDLYFFGLNGEIMFNPKPLLTINL